MKKQLTAILTAAFLLSTFTGCNTAPTSSDSEISNSQPEASSSSKKIYSTSSLTDSFSLPPKVDSEPESDFIPNSEAIVDTEYFYPDGTVIDIQNIFNIDRDNFQPTNWGYVRYAKPIYKNSIDNPKLNDYIQSDDFKKLSEETVADNSDYFIIKEGDVLPNGLTVERMFFYYNCFKATPYLTNEKIDYVEAVPSIRFKGEFTVEGIITKSPKDGQYGPVIPGDYVLFVDTTKYENLIIPWIGYPNYSSIDPSYWPMKDGKKFIYVSDGMPIYVTSDNDTVSQLFGTEDFIKVRMTLNNLVTGSPDGGNWYTHSATLVSCELLGGE